VDGAAEATLLYGIDSMIAHPPTDDTAARGPSAGGDAPSARAVVQVEVMRNRPTPAGARNWFHAWTAIMGCDVAQPSDLR
jgi:hypothetical protein